MTITKQSGRQELLSAKIDIPFASLVSGVALPVMEMPANSFVVGGGLVVATVFDSSGGVSPTDTVVVTGASAEALLASTDVQTLGWTPLTPTGNKSTTVGNISVTWTGVGDVAAAHGALTLFVNYLVDGREEVSQG